MYVSYCQSTNNAIGLYCKSSNNALVLCLNCCQNGFITVLKTLQLNCKNHNLQCSQISSTNQCIKREFFSGQFSALMLLSIATVFHQRSLQLTLKSPGLTICSWDSTKLSTFHKNVQKCILDSN